MTDEELKQLAAKVAEELKKDSYGTGDIPKVNTLDAVYSLPANKKRPDATDEYEVVEVPIVQLQQPALDAAKVADEATENANIKAALAEEKANLANEKATLADVATGKTNKAIENAELATSAANASSASANQAAITANSSADNAEEKAALAVSAADNANDTANHPTYIGTDHYVYKWNKTTKSYNKTNIYTKGEAFSIKKVYPTVVALEDDVDNPDIEVGDFVLVNTDNVENPDNARLYVKVKNEDATYSYNFLVDMSGAIGFTGKTPQLFMGTINTSEAGSEAQATISEDGTDPDGNPKYKLNFTIPRGNPGAPFQVKGQYPTIDALVEAIPDGSLIEGFIAVGDKIPYEYYAWVNGAWTNQGKISSIESGKMVLIPSAVLNLTNTSTSNEILDAFGSKQTFIDVVTKIKNGSSAAINANGILMILSACNGITDESNNQYVLNIIFISPIDTTANFIITVTLKGDVATIQNSNYPYSYANIVSIPSDVMSLANESTSEQILAAFGGKPAFDALIEKLRADNVISMICGADVDSFGYIPIAFTAYNYVDSSNLKAQIIVSVGGEYLVLIITVANSVFSINKTAITTLSKSDLISDPSVGGSNKPASAEAVKILNATKVSSSNIRSMITLTQAEYDTIAQKDPNTLYIITE